MLRTRLQRCRGSSFGTQRSPRRFHLKLRRSRSSQWRRRKRRRELEVYRLLRTELRSSGWVRSRTRAGAVFQRRFVGIRNASCFELSIPELRGLVVCFCRLVRRARGGDALSESGLCGFGCVAFVWLVVWGWLLCAPVLVASLFGLFGSWWAEERYGSPLPCQSLREAA